MSGGDEELHIQNFVDMKAGPVILAPWIVATIQTLYTCFH